MDITQVKALLGERIVRSLDKAQHAPTPRIGAIFAGATMALSTFLLELQGVEEAEAARPDDTTIGYVRLADTLGRVPADQLCRVSKDAEGRRYLTLRNRHDEVISTPLLGVVGPFTYVPQDANYWLLHIAEGKIAVTNCGCQQIGAGMVLVEHCPIHNWSSLPRRVVDNATQRPSYRGEVGHV